MKRYNYFHETTDGTVSCSEHPEGEFVRWADVEALETEREAEYERGRKEESRLATARCREIVAKVEVERDALKARYTAQTGFFAELELERQKTTVERDALKAEVERLKAERTQDVSIRREQCEALADSERGMFAAIDRHQMAAAEVERLRAALERIESDAYVTVPMWLREIAREALEKKP